MKGQAAVITGLGAVSPYGIGVDLFWRKLVLGITAFRPITRFDAAPFRNILAGEVPDFPTPSGTSSAAAFCETAAVEAASQALLQGCNPRRTGLILGTNFGGAETLLRALARIGEAPSTPPELSSASMGEGLAMVRRKIPIQGPCAVLSLTCASGAAALGLALSWIREGRADVVLAGGYDELSLHAYAGLSSLRAITPDRIRPFDARRNGALFSEGAGMVVVESERHARERNASPLARLTGRGMNNDAFHMTAPDPSGRGIAAVMRMALADAGISPKEVVHVNCHATGTKYNDLIETQGIKQVFGDQAYRLVLTANKSCIGHALGAAGALEAIAAILSIREGVIPPTMGL
ncbi:MAG: beta-ketoacyl-[acyl-carrier-protein] synthase family protein [Planctomycetota bacterium]